MTNQRYVSHELTHFVGGGLKGESQFQDRQYDLLIKILRQGELGKVHPGANWTILMRTGGGNLSSNKRAEAQQVCFCDIPVGDLGLHMKKYSRFGVAFTKRYLVATITLEDLYNRFDAHWKKFSSSRHDKDLLSLEQQVIWLFFAKLKFFDPSKDEDHNENYYMEREWRVLGTVPFSLEDVVRIILPSSFAKRFRVDVPEYWGQLTFSDEMS
ncbi:MAG: abortive infection system antitoxin AbiGi family protein [Bryobacteraceae bacterium]|jgi:hypothetical protein